MNRSPEPSHADLRRLLSALLAGMPLALAHAQAVAVEPTAQPVAKAPAAPSAPQTDRKPFTQDVPPAAFSFEMIPIPGSADGRIKPFYLAKTELTWEAFDVFVYRLDEEKGDNPPGVDAVTRPSKPYIPPDRGFGHEGYAAISISFKNAQGFCEWLSARTGRKYRLPTEAEWEHAARAGGSSELGAGPDALIDEAQITEYAWLESNSDGSPKAVATRKPNAWGLYDMIGNVREWVVGDDGKPTTKGGAYTDSIELAAITGEVQQTSAWNGSDPQVPKSKWWLSDGPFVGFRVVCDSDPAATTTSPKPAAEPAVRSQ